MPPLAGGCRLLLVLVLVLPLVLSSTWNRDHLVACFTFAISIPTPAAADTTTKQLAAFGLLLTHASVSR
jgi:hypothetical protein